MDDFIVSSGRKKENLIEHVEYRLHRSEGYENKARNSNIDLQEYFKGTGKDPSLATFCSGLDPLGFLGTVFGSHSQLLMAR